MRGKSILRPFLTRRAFSGRSVSSSSSRILLNQSYLMSTPQTNSSIPKTPFPVWTPENLNLSRYFSDSSPDFFKPSFMETEPVPVPENVVPVKSEEEFDAALSKTKDESVPAVFYFTATWCAPCRFIGPVMDELARRTPEVTVYKMDIDEEGLARKLKELNITAVPTVQYFKEGKQEVEVVGGDATRIIQTMKKLYNMRDPKTDDSKQDATSGEEVNEKN
ncbi:hypothetical protein E1A91_A03G142800v1 [Gossypium mustelinum]|uniref:Thioredoxin domain-containing protein n=4 Tax=Gossypium TaxID=3633 RepID=A0A5J5WER5_GOSBA|nr:hypothetical protein ES319_A03G139700v1 [Gossypium barbadense]TYH25295.1 hypothetical protein ES288_A03G157300v1 [Gossypium darwinii]TYI36630.1 hypothetical protein ES332_A03G154900v1 [Gossypium tomentosum]TYJ43282.1 hypothetical protein E1A91_A03G142800v1 [Gossypium mustelinum]